MVSIPKGLSFSLSPLSGAINIKCYSLTSFAIKSLPKYPACILRTCDSINNVKIEKIELALWSASINSEVNLWNF